MKKYYENKESSGLKYWAQIIYMDRQCRKCCQ